ncbi:MAG: ABC transporter permease [Leucothrix sp.]
MIVGIIFLVLIGLFIGSIIYGRRLIRTEVTDAVFGNPSRALGGWHWIVAGVSSILIIWLYFSWDAGRAFFPKAANELCQVAKLNRTANPIRSAFPLNDRLLRGTALLERDYGQMDLLESKLAATNFAEADRTELASIITEMRAALAAQADPKLMDPATAGKLDAIATRIDELAKNIADDNYPSTADPDRAEALKQPAWGATSTEIPPMPMTDLGYKFAQASEVMDGISKDFSKIRNNGEGITTKLEALKTRYKSFEIDESEGDAITAERKDLVKQIEKIYRRIDDGKIFPSAMTQSVEDALINLDDVQKSEQGSLRYIDMFAMPGGEILAGNRACSEQGSGRWLPKPSDTWNTFVKMADPDIGYKNIPLLWYEMKPIGQVLEILVPDWIADLVPGEYPRHDDKGTVLTNFKNKVYKFATGDYESMMVPVPIGHIWDSMMRVLAGLFFGIILGVPLGLYMGLSRFGKGFFDPMIELYRPIPPLAWAPLILTIFGIQDDGKIFLLFMVAFAIMVVSARTGATGTQLSKVHAAHSLGASTYQIVRKVILPNSLPEILTGIRIAIGVCWGTLVAAEMLAGTTGIGFVENVARKQSDYEIIWMTIILLGLLGLIFDLIMRFIIHRTIPWRGKG